MKKIPVSLDQVLDDDLNNPFWQSLRSTPGFAQFEQKINSILDQDTKYNTNQQVIQPGIEIPPE